MSSLQILSASEQVADYLKGELLRRRWTGTMPGGDRLVSELGIGRETVRAALSQLEDEGLLAPQGRRKRRLITIPEGINLRHLHVSILLYEKSDRERPYTINLLNQLQERGYTATCATKNLHDLGMDAKRVARFIAQTPADAWVVIAGPYEVLEWFSGQPVPAIGMFGRVSGLPIATASVRNIPPLIAGVRKLISHGHQRIVMLAREERRKPVPGLMEQAFLDEMSAQGLPTGPYNLPDWDDTPAGLLARLDMLFLHSPPSALILGDTALFIPVQQFLARRGLLVPERVSLFIADSDLAFAWASPPISRIRWDHRPVVRRILRWADNVANGREDRSQTFFKAKFVEGGTIGPVTEKNS